MTHAGKGTVENAVGRHTRRSFLERGALLFLAGATPLSFANDLPPAANLFKIERVSRHVYAAIAQTTPVVNGNSAIVVTQKGLVVVDSQSSPTSARSLYEQFQREVATLPVRYLINTHHHLDHAHGNSAYGVMFANTLDIVATDFSRAALEQAKRWFNGFLQDRYVASTELQNVPNQERYYDFVQGYVSGLRKSMHELEGQIPHLQEPTTAVAQHRLAGLRAYFADMSNFNPTLPNITFSNDLTLHCGDISVEVRHLGKGHTAGDAVVLVPADSVVMTGDLVHGLEPLLLDAFPDQWPATLDKLSDLDFETIVPGHGPVQRGRTTLTLFKDYIFELNRVVRDGVAAGKSLAALQEEITPERLQSLSNQNYGRNFQRNREALLGLPPGQPLGPVVSNGVEQVYNYYSKK